MNKEHVQIYGASDDLIEVEGNIDGADEYNNCGGDGRICYKGTLFFLHETGRMKVHCLYDGCWSFAPAQADEDVSIPEWQLEVRFCNPYSAILSMHVPAGTTVRFTADSPDWPKDLHPVCQACHGTGVRKPA